MNTKLHATYDGGSQCRDLTNGRAYEVMAIIEGCDICGHGSALPYVVFQIRDDAGDVVTRDRELFIYNKGAYNKMLTLARRAQATKRRADLAIRDGALKKLSAREIEVLHAYGL